MHLNLRFVGDDWSCAPENHLPENNVKLFRRIPEGQHLCPYVFFPNTIMTRARIKISHIIAFVFPFTNTNASAIALSHARRSPLSHDFVCFSSFVCTALIARQFVSRQLGPRSTSIHLRNSPLP
jgi:hypothetical protein